MTPLLPLLACPRDHSALTENGDILCCEHGHSYPVVDGVPVFLLPELDETMGIASASLKAANERTGAPLYLETLGLSDEERRGVNEHWRAGRRIDPAIAHLVAATSGYGYKGLVGHMADYPIPDIPVGRGNGRMLLDIGCSWGRWTVSAARKGWKSVGIDPSLGALMAAKRAFDRERLPAWFVCADARALPFKPGVFDQVYSYSVLQHFSEEDAKTAFAQAGRVLKAGGESKIQMAQKWGLRSTYIRKRAPGSGPFRVRYWSIPDLQAAFDRNIGPSRVDAEAFGGLGLLREDIAVVSWKAKALTISSLTLRATARVIKPLRWVADSVFVTSEKPG